MDLPHTERFKKPYAYIAVTGGELKFCSTEMGVTVAGTIGFAPYYITVTIETIDKGLLFFLTDNFVIKKAMQKAKEQLKLSGGSYTLR